MNNFTRNYEKILATLQSVEDTMNFLNQIRIPKFSDIELIAVDLTTEFMGIDSERDLFRKLPTNLCSKIERSVYDRRKRKLFSHRELIRKNIANIISSNDFYNSIPIKSDLKCLCERINMVINLKPISFENLEKGLKHYSLSHVTNL